MESVGLFQMFFLLTVTEDLFKRKKKQSVGHCSKHADCHKEKLKTLVYSKCNYSILRLAARIYKLFTKKLFSTEFPYMYVYLKAMPLNCIVHSVITGLP